MHTYSFSSAESRFLFAYIDPTKVKKVSTRGQIVNATPTKTTSQAMLPSGDPTSTFVSNGKTVNSYDTPLPSKPQGNVFAGQSAYNINLDPTYSGMIGAETGYTGDPLTAGNVGPSAGQSWSGGDGATNADPFKSLAAQADEYARSQNPLPNPATPGYAEAMVAYNQALQASRAEFIGRKQIEQQQQQQSSQRSQNAMNSFAAGQDINAKTQPEATPALGAAGLTRRLNNMTSRQDFIQQQRDMGKSDAEIREMIRTMPPEQTGGATPTVTPTPQTNAPAPITQPEATTQEPAATPTPQPTQQPEKPKGDSSVPVQPAPVIPPVASSIGEQMYQVALANGDPMAGITKKIYDDLIAKEAAAKERAAISLGESIVGAETEFTDTQSFIDKWIGIATKNSNNLTSLLQTQNEETNKVLEQQKSNALQKLEFDRQIAVQKAEKQKADEVLRSSIAIGLRGGAYSGAAQNALADAERTWDTNIMNLSKEFSFKAADVVTDFTSKYVTAKQNLALNLFNASEALSTKVEGYANAGFASLQAKKRAISEAKNAYRTTLDKISEDHSKEVKELAKGVSDRIEKQRDDKRAQDKLDYDRSWDSFKFQQDQIYRYDALAQTAALREDALDVLRDDKEKYNAQLVSDKIRQQIEGNRVFDQFKDARMSLESLTSAYNEKTNPFRDRAMAKSYEKLVEVGSVVMPGEYADIVSNIPLGSLIQGKFQKVLTGGQSWTDKERDAIKTIGESLFSAYEKRRNQEAQIFNAAIQFHNQNTSNPSYQLSPSMFNLPEPTSSRQLDSFKQLLPAGYQSPFSQPATSAKQELQSGVFDGRKVTLARPAFDAFAKANEEFKRDFGTEIRIGAVALSTFRDQKNTIKSMADRVGIPFNAENPNATAEVLRSQGHPVANIGGSKHEKGLAIDLYPGEITIGGKKMKAQQYISLVKPYLEKHGIKQMNHQGNDPGNFEFSPIS